MFNPHRREQVGKIDQKVKDQLDLLEREVEFFSRVTEQAIKMNEVGEEELQGEIKKSLSNPSSKIHKMIERADSLKSNLETLETHYELRARLAKKKNKRQI